MRCERCKQNIARLTVTLNTSEGPRQAHLCPTCALSLPVYYAPARKAVRADRQCPGCHMTLRELSAGGRLGCARCYETFELDLADILNRVQGTDRHVAPADHTNDVVPATLPDDELGRLRLALKQAVAAEDYLLAARLRDEIRTKEANDELVQP